MYFCNRKFNITFIIKSFYCNSYFTRETMFEKHKKKGEQSYMLISSVNLISFLIWIFAENFIDAKP